jgi:1-acyl-sn-glycerol-3-phosphate acyltransferase
MAAAPLVCFDATSTPGYDTRELPVANTCDMRTESAHQILSNLESPQHVMPSDQATRSTKYIGDAAGNYHTPAQQPSWWARLAPSPVFYFHFLRAVLRYSRMARQGRYDDDRWYESSLAVQRALERTGAQIQITGLNVLEEVDGPCLFIANHMSTLETIFLPGIIQPLKDVTFVVKRALADMPIFKHIILTREPIVVDRVNPREDLTRVLTQGAALLARGRSIVVFPQTTRTTLFDPTQFNTIGIKLARDAHVPIIPVAIRSDAWGNSKWIKEFGKIDPTLPVHFAFGSPLTVQGRGTSTHQAVVHFISDRLQAWGSSVLASPPPSVIPTNPTGS